MKQPYYEYLRKVIQDARLESETLDPVVLYLPDFYKLLCDILDEDIIFEEYGPEIRAALAYFVIPNDIVPEELYGIAGYMDDLYVSCYVLKLVYHDYPEVIEKYWMINEDFSKILDLCYTKSEKELEENNIREKTLAFAGFKV